MAAVPGGAGSAGVEITEAGQNNNLAFSSLIILFFMMGFITCMNDILIPYMKEIFVLSYAQANWINLCFFGAYFFMSIPSAKIVEKIGYKKGMITGFIVAAIGAFLFYPAAEMRVYGLFLGALFILASGIVLLQVSGNPYVSILGPSHTASARLTLAQAFNSLGTTIAPLIGTALILASLPEIVEGMDASTLDVKAVQIPYLGIGGIMIFIALILAALKLPQIKPEEVNLVKGGDGKTNALQYSHLLLGTLGIFCYVGAEVTIGSHIVDYLALESVMSMPKGEAGNFIALYWGSAMVGRFMGSLSLKRHEYSIQKFVVSTTLYSIAGFVLITGLLLTSGKIDLSQAGTYVMVFGGFALLTTYLAAYVIKLQRPAQILAYNAVINIILIVVSILSTGYVAMVTILLIGFLNSIMFPTIFTLAINGLGRFTDQATGYLCTAIVGGALLPFFYGLSADYMGLKGAMFIPILAYAYIAFYGLKGHRVSRS
jgi:MFS transporter, FHS family, L-fucose permease